MNNRIPDASKSPVRAGSVVRSRRKTLTLEITREGELIVRAPFRTPDSAIEDFIREKQGWIVRKMAEIKRHPRPVAHWYEEGEMFLFLGGSYPLTFVDDDRTGIRRLDRLYVPRSMEPWVRSGVKHWFMREAQLIVRERCAYFSMVTGLLPASVHITDAWRRWGSCTHAGTINFSWRLVQAPLRIIDYVVVHELVHLRQPDHSKKFWGKVEAILPDYRERRKWLRENECLLEV